MILHFLVALLTQPAAHAVTYPWVDVRPSDLYFFHSGRVEQAVRLKLIKSAKRTIDFAIYDQRIDRAVALPVLKALREAADRGVKIRFLTAWHASYAGDIHQEAPRYLTDPPTKTPVEFIWFGGTELEPQGWKFSDTVHHKQLIVDGEVTMTTGRGHAEVYLNWIDTAALIRGQLLTQTITAFERIWEKARQYRKPFQPKTSWFSKGRTSVPEFEPDEEKTRLRDGDVDEYLEASEWLADPSHAAPGLDHRQPIRGRTLHHDFLEQLDRLPKRPTAYGFEERAKILQDPVIDALIDRLRTARDIRINTLSVIMLPRLRDALAEAARRGAKIQVFTDSKAAVETIVPGAPPWMVSLPEMEDLLALGAELYAFQPKEGFEYLHRKLAILDDAVIYGSHNFNLPSTTANDEMSYEFESAELAASLRKVHDADVARFGLKLSLEMIRAERQDTSLRRWLFKPFIGFF